MKKHILLMGLLVSVVAVSGCTHKKIDVARIDDANISCEQIKTEMAELDALEADIDKKTGISGRNVGMAFLFWPGIVINEVNASDARDRAAERKEKLVGLHSSKGCS